jgi:hypothetical protein
MAERTNARLLKSREVQASVGSNPTPSAERRSSEGLSQIVCVEIRAVGRIALLLAPGVIEATAVNRVEPQRVHEVHDDGLGLGVIPSHGQGDPPGVP